jgi:hypothetical protein
LIKATKKNGGLEGRHFFYYCITDQDPIGFDLIFVVKHKSSFIEEFKFMVKRSHRSEYIISNIQIA